jgi:pectinesterase
MRRGKGTYRRLGIGFSLALSALLLVAAATGCTARKAAETNGPEGPPTAGNGGVYQAIVDGRYTGEAGALFDGAKMYGTIQEALNDAPLGRAEPYKIFIKNGTYREKLVVNKPHIWLIGESAEQTKIVYDLAAGHKKPDGSEWGTDCATVTVLGGYFTAENLTIENAFDYMANMKKPDGDPTKVAAQALALRVDGASNHAVFRNVRLRSWQDTLLANKGTQYYVNCTIEGAVDFIYGGGQAVFDHCTIVSLDRGSQTNNGYITAASTPASQKYGFLFIDCRLVKEHPDMADGTVSLGRPWHNVPHVVFKNCYMDSHISAAGWVPMSGNSPADARLFEYGSTGPGALASETRRVLTDEAAKEYTIANVLGGWNPAVR